MSDTYVDAYLTSYGDDDPEDPPAISDTYADAYLTSYVEGDDPDPPPPTGSRVVLPGGMPDLPESVLKLVELPPAEQIFLKILRDAMPDVMVLPRIPINALSPEALALPNNPLIVARKSTITTGIPAPDPRFLGESLMEVHTFTTEPDGERKGLLLSEACRVALRDAWLNHKEYPGLGAVSRIIMLGAPARKADWSTALGPVQYADLPADAWRFETRYRLIHRRPH